MDGFGTLEYQLGISHENNLFLICEIDICELWELVDD